MWEQGIEDFTKASDIKIKMLPLGDRQIAESLYDLALCYEYSDSFDLAETKFSETVTTLDKRIELLKQETSDAATVEIKEIQELVTEITSKVKDMLNRKVEINELKKKSEEEALNASDDNDDSEEETEKVINDVSGLVKKKEIVVVVEETGEKRKVESEESKVEDSESKKPKVETE